MLSLLNLIDLQNDKYLPSSDAGVDLSSEGNPLFGELSNLLLLLWRELLVLADFSESHGELVHLLLDGLGGLVALDLPHLGLWVELDVGLELVVESFHLLANLAELFAKLWAVNVVHLPFEFLVSGVHLLELLFDVELHVLELSLDLWLLEELHELHPDGVLLLVGVGLELQPSGVDLLELHSVFWGVELGSGLLESVTDIHPVLLLVSLIFGVLETNLVDWALEVLDVLPDLLLFLLDFGVDLWVHGDFPHGLLSVVDIVALHGVVLDVARPATVSVSGGCWAGVELAGTGVHVRSSLTDDEHVTLSVVIALVLTPLGVLVSPHGELFTSGVAETLQFLVRVGFDDTGAEECCDDCKFHSCNVSFKKL